MPTPCPRWSATLGGRRARRAIHDNHYGLVQGNEVWDTAGAGVAGELGSETGNVISGTYVTQIYGSVWKGDYVGTSGDGSWFRGPSHIITDNVATSMVGDAYRY